jgi:hypothetical protein
MGFDRREWQKNLSHNSHTISTAAAHPGMFTLLRSVRLFDVLSSTSAGPSVALAEMRRGQVVFHGIF